MLIWINYADFNYETDNALTNFVRAPQKCVRA